MEEEEQIITVNLEDGDYRGIRTSEKLYQYVESKLVKSNKNYVFLDEVQQVENFQEAVDWLYVKKNVDLYITGSNAFLLSGELATLLSGRYVEIKMFPFFKGIYISIPWKHKYGCTVYELFTKQFFSRSS
ncbi:MAG: ATP-binding protein [Enterocloster clostridioformis]